MERKRHFTRAHKNTVCRTVTLGSPVPTFTRVRVLSWRLGANGSEARGVQGAANAFRKGILRRFRIARKATGSKMNCGRRCGRKLTVHIEWPYVIASKSFARCIDRNKAMFSILFNCPYHLRHDHHHDLLLSPTHSCIIRSANRYKSLVRVLRTRQFFTAQGMRDAVLSKLVQFGCLS